MKIKRVYIAGFGKHVDYEMDFDDGLNIYSFENEWGKSTLLEFIRAMFYGLRKNTRGNDLSDYDRYKPWDTKEFEGTIEYEIDGKESFKVYRNFETKEVKVWNQDNVDVTATFPISKEIGVNFASIHLGITSDIFDKVVYLKQNQAQIDIEKDKIAESAINIIQTGDKEISVDKVLANLKKQILEKVGNSRTVGRPINLLNQKVKNLENEKFEIDSKISLLTDRLNEIDEYSMIKSDMEKEIEKIQIADNIRKLEKEYSQNEKNYIAQKDEERRIKIMRMFWIGGAVGCILAAIISRFIPLALPALLSLIEGVIYTKRIKEQKIEFQDKIEIENELLSKINSLKEEFNEKFSEEYDETKIINRSMKEIMDEYAQVNVDLFEAENTNKKIEELKERSLEIAEEIVYCADEVSKLKEKEEALNLAIDTIKESLDELSRDFYPIIEKDFNSIEKEIIDDKDRTFKLTKEGEKVQLRNGNMLTVEALSHGTKEQLFLALRIAISNFYASGRKLPLLLDDIFAYWDNERIDRGIEVLKKLGEDRQIIIFTSN